MNQVGPYEILEPLAHGGMGVVYKAWDTTVQRFIALKAIRFDEAGDENEKSFLQSQLRKEARSAGGLSHPNIVTIYHFLEAGDVSYLAMELVVGRTLQQLMRLGQSKDHEKSIGLLEQAASALDYAHGHGVIHRDIKPANFLIRDDGVLKVLDFGIARLEGAHTQTPSNLLMGTPHYMSPEQLQAHSISGAADQFSLAVVAYELLTGKRPFEGQTPVEVMTHVLMSEAEAAHLANPALWPAVTRVLVRALSKTPQERYESCVSFVSDLRSALVRPSSSAETVLLPPVQAQVRPIKRRRWLRVTLGTLVGIVVIPGGIYLSTVRPQKSQMQTMSHATQAGQNPSVKTTLPKGNSHPEKSAAISETAVTRSKILPQGRPPETPAVPNRSTEKSASAREEQHGERASNVPVQEAKPADPPSDTVTAGTVNKGSQALNAEPPQSPPRTMTLSKESTVQVQPSPPTPAYPHSGALHWNGQLSPESVLTIEGVTASKGSLTGARLPGVPVKIVEVRPEWIATTEAPSPSNGWKKIVLVNRGSAVPGVFLRWELIR